MIESLTREPVPSVYRYFFTCREYPLFHAEKSETRLAGAFLFPRLSFTVNVSTMNETKIRFYCQKYLRSISIPEDETLRIFFIKTYLLLLINNFLTLNEISKNFFNTYDNLPCSRMEN